MKISLEPNSLWCRVFCSKYGLHLNGWESKARTSQPCEPFDIINKRKRLKLFEICSQINKLCSNEELEQTFCGKKKRKNYGLTLMIFTL